MFRERLRILLLIYTAGLTLVALRFFQIQIIRREFYAKRSAISTIHHTIKTPLRGAILDRNGTILVRSTASYDVEVKVHEIQDPLKLSELFQIPLESFEEQLEEIRLQVATASLRLLEDKIMAKVLPLLLKKHGLRSKSEFLEQVGEAVLQTALEKWQKENPRTYNSYKKASEKEAEQEYYPFLTSISYDLACRFHLHKEQYPGIRIQASSRRVYEDSTCAPHLMGRLGLMNKEEYEEKRFQGYIATDRLGKTGIERYYENQLKGKRGLKLIEFDKNTLKNNIIFEDQDPVKNEVQLTLDFPLQKFTETVLDSYPGKDGKGPRLLACVLLRAEDGQVLAMATTPRYDLERFGKDYPQLKDDPRHPLLNRCIQNFIVPNPGSVFKLVTAMALLEEGIATPDHTADCQGYLFNPRSFRCHIWEYRRGHGTVDLPHALEQSCNIYFYRYGELLGIEKLAYWSKKCGFGQKTGIEGDGEQAGLVPTPEWLQGNTFIPPEERSWTTGLTRLCAIGQKIEVTPLQVARFFCALGNGGYLVQPHLVHDPEKNYRESEPLCSSNTMKELLKGMELVTYGERGTGNRYGLQAFGFIGKTGTADTSKGEEPHAWLAGFAPKERPEVTLVLMAEKAGHGGEVCGPLAQKILDFYFKKLKNRIPEEF